MPTVQLKSIDLMFTKHDFLNSKSAYRVQPFWFWNGEMEENEIYHQIKEMDKG